MPANQTYIWQEAPFFRLLLSFCTGIIIQWHYQLPFDGLVVVAAILTLFIISYFFLPVRKQYMLGPSIGLTMLLIIVVAGALAVHVKDVRNNGLWVGNHLKGGEYTVATLAEPLIEKPNSYKALAEINAITQNDSIHKVKGKVILYFAKDSSPKVLGYGSQIVFKAPLQEIKNAGNPGSFDYKRYALFAGITHQAYLRGEDIVPLPEKQTTYIGTALLRSKNAVISTLKRFIRGYKEQGLAEALLIGYKDDLDKKLVQSYSNTGVVHIIAISGLHLGLIYLLLLKLTSILKRKGTSWLRFIIIIACLWAFTLLAGAQPSVLRSAIMFSFLAFGELLNKRKSNYNLLACSAFLLLCFNPFWLWDVGFQLSYSAVLSIMIFYRPIYNIGTTSNKAFDKLWQYISVTLAAQILTLPIILYHFHQFPVLFLVANLVAVPLSSLILYGELLLMVVSFILPVARILGRILEVLIQAMNLYIERLDRVSFSVWNGFSISIMQIVFLYGIIAGISYWLLDRKKVAAGLALFCLLAFTSLRTYSFLKANEQLELVVYNVPKHSAIDVIKGRSYFFIGDSSLVQDGFLRNFHLQPSRLMHRVSPLGVLPYKNFLFSDRRFMIIDTSIKFLPAALKSTVDVLILSRKPRLNISDLQQAFYMKQIVVDGSVPAWKKGLWKKECDSLRIPYYDVSEKGAFVMKMR